MYLNSVNIYQLFGKEFQPGAGGNLTIYGWQTPQKISLHGRKRPAVLILPGGGYEHVSEREGESVALEFVSRGYVAFVLTYTVAPARFPVALREAAMAMRYIREQADALEVNPHMVAAVGFSAGGHLCGTLGTMYDAPEVRDIGPGELLRPNALGLCYPVAVSWGRTHEGSFRNLCGGDVPLRKWLSLDSLVRPDMPPVYLWHTRTDESVPVRNSLLLGLALDEAGVDFAMDIFPRGPHGLSLADARVYPAWNVPERSDSVTCWPEMMMKFFAERGFAMTDGDR